MIDIDILVGLFSTNAEVLHRQMDGLTHEDSLLQLPFRGNCLNWVLGHILASRTMLMRGAGIEPVWTEEQRAQYMRGSEPITADNYGTAYSFDAMLRDLDESQVRILAHIQSLTPELIDAPSDLPDRNWGKRFAMAAWHEGYHAGQTEILRQLAGKNDRIIG